MNYRIGLLAGIALAQIMIIALVLLLENDDPRQVPSWLDLQDREVTRFSITDGDAEVTMTETDGLWSAIAADQQVPADGDKVAQLLDKLAGLSAPWPVATSAASAERFEVTDDSFQRRLALYTGDEEVALIFLGTSPGFERVHARRADSDEIFSVALSNYELPVTIDGWLDKGLLGMSEDIQRVALKVLADADVTELSLADAQLQRSDEGWLINGGVADQAAAQTYVNRFKTLQVLGLAEASHETHTVLAQLTLAGASGEVVLEISTTGENGDYLVQDTARAGTYRLAAYIAEQLLMTDTDFSVDDEPVDVEVGEESDDEWGEDG